MKLPSIKIIALFLALVVIFGCFNDASQVPLGGKHKVFGIQGINTDVDNIHFTSEPNEQTSVANRVTPAEHKKQLGSKTVEWRGGAQESNYSFWAERNNVVIDTVGVNFPVSLENDPKDWIILSWDGTNLTARLATDPEP